MPAEEIPGVLAERDATLGWHKNTDRENASRLYRRIAEVVARARR